MAYRWMPTWGEFEISQSLIRFKGKAIPRNVAGIPEGPTDDAPNAAVGILLCDQEMSNGRLSADVRFSAVTAMSVCEFILAYEPNTKRQLVAGIGGGSGMFSIREFGPSDGGAPGEAGWSNFEIAGDRANLTPKRTYHMEANVVGSKVALTIDGVHVASTVLRNAASRRSSQVGIFCLGYDDVEIASFCVEAEKPTAFVVMQFSSPYDEVYSHVIKDVCGDLSVDALRADEIPGPGIIIRDIVDRIARAQVVIADISPPNPNVYFEVGYALALKKPIILLAQRVGPEAKLPFDLSPFRVLFYENSIGGKAKLEEGLKVHLKEILGRR